MARRWASAALLKGVFNLVFFALFLQTLAFAEWLFASSISWHSPIKPLLPYFFGLLAAQIVALLLYFRLPWLAVLVAWLGALLILTRAISWHNASWRAALHEFQFEIVFLVLAHAGFAAFVFKKRAEAEEIAEVLGAPPESGESQS